MKRTLRAAAVFGGLAVALGAFGAHGLRGLLDADQLTVFHTGVRYQFYHALALGLIALLCGRTGFSDRWLRRAAWCWSLGIVLFSGSLYLLSLRPVHGLAVGFLGPVTPVGGLLFLAGWVFLFLAPQSPKEKHA